MRATLSLTDAAAAGEESPRASASLPGRKMAWSLAGALVWGACQWGAVALIARLGTPEALGQYMLGLAITAPAFMLSALQLRSIQATDAGDAFTAVDFLSVRLLTTAAVAAMIVVGLIASGQRGEAALVMVGVTLVKAVESIADVIYGFLQKQQRTDLIGRSQILKSPLYLAAIAGGYVAAGRLSVGLYAVVALSLLSTAALEGRQALRLGAVRRSRRHEPARPNPAAMWRIVRLALPLGVAGGLNSLRANIVRYLMAYFMGQGAVGIYAALAYVPAGVSLAASTLAQAVSPQLARAFVRGREAEFRMLAFKLLGVALGIGSGALGVVLLAGPRLLDVLYGARYAAEHPVFVIAMAGLGFTCAAAYMNDALVARRLMASQLRIICLVGVVETVLGALLLQGHGLRGAATATLIASALQCFAATWVAMSDSWGRRRAAQESAAC